jgi:iron complex outermembrane receptor protein
VKGDLTGRHSAYYALANFETSLKIGSIVFFMPAIPVSIRTAVISLLVAIICCVPVRALAGQAAAQHITGRVVDASGQALPGATVSLAVSLDGATHETMTGADGRFRLASVATGRYTLRIVMPGFEPFIQEVQVGQDEPPPIQVTLAEGGYLFEQVQVIEEGYAVRRSLTSTRTSTELRNIPQSIQVVNKDLFVDQGATYLNDTLRNVSGVTMFSEYLDFNMRGFRSQSDGAVKVDGLNLVQDFFVKPRLLNVERVEVVKGPAGALYGTSKPGGFINIITKQPAAERATNVSLQLGSWSKSQIQGDTAGAVPGVGGLFYRLDAARSDDEGFRRFEHVVYSGIHAAVTWAPRAQSSITADGEWFEDSYQGHRNRGVPFYDHRLVDVPSSFTVNEPGDEVAIDASTFRVRGLHQIAEHWRLDAAVASLSNDSTQLYHEPIGLRPGGRLMLREFRDQYREKSQAAANVNVSWDTTFAGLRHDVLFGGEYSLMNGLLQSGTARDSSRGGPVPDLDIYNPVYGEVVARPPAYYGVPGGIGALTTSTNNRTRASGLYVQDQVTIGSRINLLAGARYDEFRDDTRSGTPRSRTGDAISLRAGAVIHATTAVSFYGNYAEGFEPPSASYSLEPERYGGPFDPERSRSIEGGVKGLLLGERLTTTLALYEIVKRDMLLRSPTADLPDRIVPVGEFKSRGVEIDVTGRVTRALSLYANYAHSFLAEVVNDVNPANLGKAAENNPRDAASVWARYDVTGNRPIRVGVAGGVAYVGRRLTFEAGDILPSYTRWDAAIILGAGRGQLSINVFNLTDTRYFTGGYGGRNGGFLGSPRGADVRLSYRF